MQLRHERRRRWFSDDMADVSSGKPIPLAGSATGQTGRPANSYTEAAQLARDRAVCTLLPTRLLTIGLAVGGCLMLVGACLSLHVGFPAMASLLPADDVAFLRLDAPGSVGHWLASTLLAVAGVLAAFIYSLRRHRIDDYHGRYRVWIWIFAACLAASLAETTGLGRLARAVCRLATEWLSVRSEALWSATFGLVVAAIGLRLFLEIRKSRWAVAALAASALGFLVAAAVNAGWPARWTGAGKPLFARGSWLVGYVFVLATFLLYSRYVQLDVAGAIAMPVKRKRSKSKAPANDDAKSEPSEPYAKPALYLRTDLDPVDASTVDSESRSQQATDAQVADAAWTNPLANASQKPKKHFSKAERRRLRREAGMAS